MDFWGPSRPRKDPERASPRPDSPRKGEKAPNSPEPLGPPALGFNSTLTPPSLSPSLSDPLSTSSLLRWIMIVIVITISVSLLNMQSWLQVVNSWDNLKLHCHFFAIRRTALMRAKPVTYMDPPCRYKVAMSSIKALFPEPGGPWTTMLDSEQHVICFRVSKSTAVRCFVLSIVCLIYLINLLSQ